MDASILVIGSDDFRSILLEPIYDLATFTVEVASDPLEAAPLIQAQQPDLLVMQAAQPGSLSLCRQIKEQSRLAWIYCILLGDRSDIKTGIESEKIQAETEALEAGADIYGWISPAHLNAEGAAAIALHHRLLQAYLQVGLRRVRNHRELVRTNDLLSTIALSDPLTELNNRRALEWELPRQVRNARSRQIPMSLLMMDVDYFKTINDTYGHLVGDRALKLLSARLRYNLRYYDTPFRYGGEEFVIILGDTSEQEALLIANRICRLIADQPFAIDENLDLKITVSAGAASLCDEDDPKGISLLQRADQFLLAAKSQGRNRVVSYSKAP